MLEIGSELSGEYRYRVESLLGHGGVSLVYLVKDIERQQLYAAKILSDHSYPIDTEIASRFSREAHLLQQVSHPNLVDVREVLHVGTYPVLVMEHCARGSLYSVLRAQAHRQARVPLEIVLPWANQILSALGALHRNGIVHRDITPKNLLWRQDSSLAVADLGAARMLADETITGDASRLGSLIYISAEQREDPHTADVRDDFYSVGQVLFHLLSGIVPHGNAGVIATHRPELSELSEAVELLRSFKREDRPPTALDAEASLNHAASRDLQRYFGHRKASHLQLELYQRRELDRLRNQNIPAASGLLRPLLNLFGPYWLGPIKDSLEGTLEGGSFGFFRGETYWDGGAIQVTYLQNCVTGRSLALDGFSGHSPSRIDTLRIPGVNVDAFLKLRNMPKRDQAELLKHFTFASVKGATHECRQCGRHLTLLLGDAKPAPHRLAFCGHCNDNSDVFCASCGGDLQAGADADEWGAYDVLRCANCRLEHNELICVRERWWDWAGMSRGEPEVGPPGLSPQDTFRIRVTRSNQ